MFSRLKEHMRRFHDRIAPLTGMILVTSAGLFGAIPWVSTTASRKASIRRYSLGFYDGVKEGERIRGHLLSRRM
jgi:hypothetical protein